MVGMGSTARTLGTPPPPPVMSQEGDIVPPPKPGLGTGDVGHGIAKARVTPTSHQGWGPAPTMGFPHPWLGQKVDGCWGKAAPLWGGGLDPGPHPRGVTTQEHHSVTRWVPCRFYEKVQALHQDPKASVDNPLLAFSLIKRLHSDWPNVIYSDEATENTQGTGRGGGGAWLRVPSVTWGEPGGDGEWMEDQRNGWRSRRMGGGAREWVKEQGNGWKSRVEEQHVESRGMEKG